MGTYTVHAAKTNLSKLIERAEKGEEIVIARGKKPVARLVPVGLPAHIRRRRSFGVLKGKLNLPNSFFDPLSEEELRLWERPEELWAPSRRSAFCRCPSLWAWLGSRQLPGIHRAFDRMLAAQARAESLTLVSADPAFATLGVAALWH